MKQLLLALVTSFFLIPSLLAHPGRTDEKGCHNVSSQKKQHCHGEKKSLRVQAKKSSKVNKKTKAKKDTKVKKKTKVKAGAKVNKKTKKKIKRKKIKKKKAKNKL